MGNQLPPWDARQRSPKYQPKTADVRRALEVASGQPFRRLTIKNRLFLNLMKKLIDLFKNSFLLRRVTSVVVAAGAAINTAKVAPELSPETLAHVQLFVMAGASFLFECAQKWLRLKFQKPTAVKNVPEDGPDTPQKFIDGRPNFGPDKPSPPQKTT